MPVRTLLYFGAVRVFVEIDRFFDVFEIRDFRNGIKTRFASPRVR